MHLQQEKIGLYTVDSQIGAGTSANVFKARDERLQRWVAIKVLHEYHKREDLVEARELAKINHPNVVSVFDIVEHEDSLAIVMEYVPGKTLADAMQDLPLDTKEALEFGIEIAKGLDAIHDAGLVHRDIKPENIFVDEQKHIKIGDFGIAISSNQAVSHAGKLHVGSVYGLSPEQIEQKEVGQASDLFSLGVLLFHLISGSHPFSAQSAKETLDNVINTDPKQIHSGFPSIDALIMQLLSLEARNRPASASEVAQRLKTILQQEFNPYSSRTLEQASPLLLDVRKRQKKRKTRRILASLIGIFVVFSGLVWRFWPEPSQYIAVTNPIIQNTDASADLPLIKASVHQATVNVLQSMPEYKLVASNEVPRATDSVNDIQSITAADQVLLTYLDCTSQICAVSFSHWEGQPAVLTKQELIQIPTERLLYVNDFVQEFLLKWLNYSSPSKALGESAISPQWEERAYREFLEYRQAYLTKALELETYIARLETLNDPRCDAESLCYELLLAYRRMFGKTRDNAWVEKSRRLLAQATHVDRKHRLLAAAVEIEMAAQHYTHANDWLLMLENKNAADDTVRSLRARWYFSQGLTEKAKALLGALIESRPSAHHLFNYALMLFRTGDYDSSLLFINLLLNRVPEHRRGMEMKAILQYYKGDWQAAIDSYESLITLDGGRSAMTLSNLGFALMMNKQFEKAYEYFENAVALAPENPQIIINLADTTLLLGRRAEAEALYQQVVAIITQFSAPTANDLLTLAQAYAHLGNKESAMSILIKIENTGANDPFTDYFLSLIYAILDEQVTSLAYERKAKSAGIPETWFDIIWFQSTKALN